MLSHLTLASALLALGATACRWDDPDVNTGSRLPNCYKWPVTQWSAGTARAGGSYDFHVSGPDDGKRPPFTAYCHGDAPYEGAGTSDYKDCEVLEGFVKGGNTSPIDQGNGLTVKSWLEPVVSGSGEAKIHVKLSWVDEDRSQWTLEGWHTASFNQFVGGGETFDITPGGIVGS